MDQPSPTPATPIKKLTVMIDASVYRGNCAVGEQLAGLFELLKKKGVECRLVQDRLGVMEATNNMHELLLSEDIDAIYQQHHGSLAEAAKALRHRTPEYIDNYLAITEDIASQVPITYVQSSEYDEIVQEKRDLARTYLFGDPRLHSEWPQIKQKLLDKRIRPADLDDYHYALFMVCSQCSHVIEAIHKRIKYEKGFKASLSPETRKDFLLDKFAEGRKIFWDHINLEKMDPDHIPTPVIDAFTATPLMQKLLGKGNQLTDLGRLMVHKQMDLGEKAMERCARRMATAEPGAENIVLLLSDDGEALRSFVRLEEEHPSCIGISSRELAKIVCKLAKNPTLKGPHFSDAVRDTAWGISQGHYVTDSPRSRNGQELVNGSASFVDRVQATAKANGNGTGRGADASKEITR